MNRALMAAILAGPGAFGLSGIARDIEDVYDELDNLPKRSEPIPVGQCHGCRTRISANKDYCLKCKTEKEPTNGR